MPSPSISVFQLESGLQTGIYNMALDECLLEFVRTQSPMLIVRTYEWNRPTLSLGVNQKPKDLERIWKGRIAETPAMVRRPTGGRAILHGEDIAFSFITNDPALLNCPLKESYCILTKWIKEALKQTGVDVADSCETDSRAYTLSSACFETQTPSDLLDKNGHKICGSAQLRRAGGLLQHGSAFLNPYHVASHDFSLALFEATARHYQQESLPTFILSDDLQTKLAELESCYSKESTEILANAETTAGSHLDPASF